MTKIIKGPDIEFPKPQTNPLKTKPQREPPFVPAPPPKPPKKAPPGTAMNEKELIREAMRLLGSRTSKRKKKSSAANIAKAREARQARTLPTGKRLQV